MTLPGEPFFFHPRFEEKIWGGRRLDTLLGKLLPADRPIGESWEISAVENNQTIVASGTFAGQPLGSLYKASPLELVGAPAASGPSFPLLVKFIDANDRLSIQVHPDDRIARERFGEPYGKTECWYVADAGRNGSLGIGLMRELTQDELRRSIETAEIENILNTVRVKTGEVYFIPAGTVHAILGDLLIYEVQQNSNTTLRLYDWQRTDASGRSRELHVEDAIAAADLTVRESYRIEPIELRAEKCRHWIRIACPYFALEEYAFGEEATAVNLPPKSSCRILTFLCGEADLRWAGGIKTIGKGATALLPASLKECTVYGRESCRFLSTTIPALEHEITGPLIKAGYSPERIKALGGENR